MFGITRTTTERLAPPRDDERNRIGRRDHTGSRTAPAWRATLCAVAITCAAGCAPLAIQPVRPDRASYPAVDYGGVSIAYGYDYADRMAISYYERLADDLGLVSNLGRFQIVNAAVVLGLAAFGAHTDAITGAALIGGTSYALGNWDRNEGRRGIYVEGIKAMVCAKRAIAPLDFGKEMRTALQRDLNNFDTRTSQLAEAFNAVETWTLREQVPANVELAEARRRQALQDLAAALIERGRGAQVLRAVDGAGNQLALQVDEINIAVNKALAGTATSLDALPSFIGNLSAFTQIFAPEIDLNALRTGRFQQGDEGSTESLRGADKSDGANIKEQPAPDLALALGLLEQRRVEVNTAAQRLKTYADAVDKARIETDLAGCGVDIAKVPVGLTLSTARIEFQQGTAQTFRLRASGGTRGYWAQFDETTPGLSLRNPRPDESVIEITAVADATPGEYTLRVGDAAGHERQVEVVVEKTQGNTDDVDRSADTTAAEWQTFLKGNEGSLFGTRSSVVDAQAALCTPLKDRDGKLGPDSRLRIRIAREDLGQASQDLFDKALLDALHTSACKGLGEENRLEDRLLPLDICRVRVAIGLAPGTKTLDAEFRQRLVALAAAGDTGLAPDVATLRAKFQAGTDVLARDAAAKGMLSKGANDWLVKPGNTGNDVGTCG